MSFYFRKSIKVGPFRYNLSKSGIGVSTGIPGLRVGSGPRGNYIHVGRKGVYYRKSLSGKTRGKQQPNLPGAFSQETSSRLATPGPQMVEIESADTLQLSDSSSRDLLVKINANLKRPRLALIFLIPLLLGLCIWFAILGYLLETFTNPIIGILITLVIVVSPLLVAGMLLLLHYRDNVVKTTVLFFNLDKEAAAAYRKLLEAFKEISHCKKIWHIETEGKIHTTHDKKVLAGADTLISRKPTKILAKTPKLLKTNLVVPTVQVGKQTLCFCPDRVFILEKKRAAAITYKNIDFTPVNTKFIEVKSLPSDSKVVGKTWQYTNVKGGPDKRFKNNRELPIVLYSEIHLTSETGLNEQLQLSKPDIGEKLSEALRELAALQMPAA